MFSRLKSEISAIHLVFALILFIMPMMKSSGQHILMQELAKKGKYQKAIEKGQGILSDSLRPAKQRTIQDVYLSFGIIYDRLDNQELSENYFQKAISMVQSKIDLGERLDIFDYNVIDEYSLFLVRSGNFPLATYWINYSRNTRVHWYNKNNPLNFRPYLALGMINYFKNQLDSASYYLKLYQFNIRNSNHTGHLEVNRYADTYDLMAEIEMDLGNLQLAKRYSEKNARLQNHSWTRLQSGKNTEKRAKALNQLSEIERYRGKLKRARRLNERAIDVFDKDQNNSKTVYAEIQVNRAWLDYLDFGLDSAIVSLRNGAEAELNFIKEVLPYLTEYEKENFYYRHRRKFNKLNALILTAILDTPSVSQHPFMGEWYNYNLNTRGILLNGSTRFLKNIRENNSDSLATVINQWRKTKDLLSELSLTARDRDQLLLDSLTQKIIYLEKGLLHAFGNEPPEVNKKWDVIAETMNTNEAVVEYLRITNTRYTKDGKTYNRNDTPWYVGFIIKKQEPISLILQNGSDGLESRNLRYYYNSIIFRQKDKQSWSKYWAHIEEKVKDANRIYLIPDGVYNLINFSTLLEPTSGRYLSEVRDLQNLTHLSDLTEESPEEQAFAERRACLIGNPNYHGLYAPLPGSETELKIIDSVLVLYDFNTIIAMEERASETYMEQLEQCEILHIASHGLFQSDDNSRNPMLNSALALTPDDQNDGRLTAYEISALENLKASLVILSACETGQGEIKSGEGVYGLQRALQVTGAKHLIMSLWKIDDQVTVKLIEKFYEFYVLTGNVTQSMKKASEEIRKEHPEPYYWAAFKVIGRDGD